MKISAWTASALARLAVLIVVIMAGTALFATVTSNFTILSWNPTRPLDIFGLAVSIVGLIAVVAGMFTDLRASWSESAALTLESKAEREETLVDYVEAQLVAAAARQNVAVKNAENRANRLSSVGFFLMVSSVLVPFGLVYLYIMLPPDPDITTGAATQRDWHLLLAGVSFGLLFIAAARGILLAEGRQREVYAREVRETAYYGDLRRALGMAQRIDREDKDEKQPATREVVRKIMALMLDRGGREPGASAAAEPAPAGEHEFLKIVADTIKK